MLIWVISSHGGEETGQGAFFADSEGERIYLTRDIMRWFSVDSFPDMQGKPVLYFPSFCRAHVPPRTEPSFSTEEADVTQDFGKSKTTL